MATPKQVRRRGRLGLVLGTVISAAIFVVGAAADDIKNDLPGTVKVMALNAGGPTGSTVLSVVPQNGDGKNGCNFQGSTASLVVSVASSDTSVATVSPTSLTFGSCGETKTVTVTPHNTGSANVALAQVSNTTSGTFNLAPAAFRVDVAPPPNTAPDVTVTGVTHGASYAKGTVPAAGCSVVDAEDGNSTFPATLSAIAGLYASDGLGSQTATCSYTDGGGLTETVTATYSIYDPSAPSIGHTLTPSSPDGNNGWYRSDVTLGWSVSEPESPNSLAKTGCVNQSITADQAATTYSCSATSAGGSAGPVIVSIKRDATAPTITGSALSAPNGNGWYKTPVTVAFACDDNLSGVAACADPVLLNSQGAGQSATRGAEDAAGNTATATVSDINIDLTAPTAHATAAPAPNANGWNNTNVTVSFSGSDGLSGIDFCSDAVVLSNEAAGQSASGTCTDKAGNQSNPTTASGINIDKTHPSVSLVGGPADGASYYFGSVPAAPTCSASDALSGLDGACSISGYATTVGSHTVSASANDKAGNSASVSRTYTVLAWTLRGFYQPVDMGDTVVNTVKGGSTVPLKFEIFAGSTELTDTANVASLTQQLVSCTTFSGDAVDEIETTATGGTSLRYDTTAGQFVYNWKTPVQTGKCYVIRMTTDDGSLLSAQFKLK